MDTLFPTKCTIVIVSDNREKKSNKEPKINTAHRSNPLKTTYNPYNLNGSRSHIWSKQGQLGGAT